MYQKVVNKKIKRKVAVECIIFCLFLLKLLLLIFYHIYYMRNIKYQEKKYFKREKKQAGVKNKSRFLFLNKFIS